MVIGGGKTRSVIAACAVALFAFSARAEWKYYAATDTDNPTSTNKTPVACITDGNWVLQVYGKNNGVVTLGSGNYATTAVYSGNGVLDFRDWQIKIEESVYNKIDLGAGALRGAKITEFYANNLTGLSGYGFWNATVKHAELGGTFASLGTWEFYGTGVTNLVINSKNFKSFGKIFFFDGATLKTLTITTTNAVSYTPSDNRRDAVKTLTVNGPAWTQTALDNILGYHSGADGSTAETAAKPCTIYVDKSMGWDGTGDYAQGWSPSALTDAEKAVKPKKCFGVYVTAAGARKAWLVNTANSKGLLLIVR